MARRHITHTSRARKAKTTKKKTTAHARKAIHVLHRGPHHARRAHHILRVHVQTPHSVARNPYSVIVV